MLREFPNQQRAQHFNYGQLNKPELFPLENFSFLVSFYYFLFDFDMVAVVYWWLVTTFFKQTPPSPTSLQKGNQSSKGEKFCVADFLNSKHSLNSHKMHTNYVFDTIMEINVSERSFLLIVWNCSINVKQLDIFISVDSPFKCPSEVSINSISKPDGNWTNYPIKKNRRLLSVIKLCGRKIKLF